MGKSISKAILGATLLGALSVSSAMAADLVLKVNAAKNSVAVTNTLPAKVTMLFLKSADNMNLPVFAQLDQGATVNVPLRFAMPAGVTTAVADVGNQRRFLTVEVK